MDSKIIILILAISGVDNHVAITKLNNLVYYNTLFDEELYDSVLDSALCRDQMEYLLNDTLGLQFLDASARLPQSISTGNFYDYGDYFQCLNIRHNVNDMDIQGKYCMIGVPLDQTPIQFPSQDVFVKSYETWMQNDVSKNMTELLTLQRLFRRIFGLNTNKSSMSVSGFDMNLAVCVPKVCSAVEALNLMQEIIPLVNFTIKENYCRLPNDKPFTSADYVAITIFSLLGVLLLLSTAYDLYYTYIKKQDSKAISKVYSCFSIHINTRRFLTFNSASGAIECMDGIRAISMMWVIVGHTYALTIMGHLQNLTTTFLWFQSFQSTWIHAAPITVDTFFLLSGVLVTYSTIGKVSRRTFIKNIYMFYLHRLLRMFPLLAVVVLLQASLFHHMSDGPSWQTVAQATDNCRQYWWSAFLHVQNYVNMSKFCLSQTWYLSVDIQLYLIAPLILVWQFGSSKLAWCAMTLAILISLVTTTVYSFLYNFSAAIGNLGRMSELLDYMQIYYMNTATRASPFFIGMAFGYLLHIHRNKTIRISKSSLLILWTSSFAMMAFCIFSIYPVVQIDHDLQMFDNFLNSYMRAIWATALGWLIFACVQGYGGPINWFLSLRLWKLPSRLSYGMYLLHFPIIMIANSSWVKTHYFTAEETFYRFMSDISITFVAAFILCILVDAPFSTITKLIFGGGKVRKQSEANLESPSTR